MPRSAPAHGALSACLLLALGLGCTAMLGPGPDPYQYFGRPDAQDAWSPKIAGWQKRERAQEGDALVQPPEVSGNSEVAEVLAEASAGSDLRAKYFDFRADRKRRTARELTDWMQEQARKHYVADGPIDHWATLEETLKGNGDDCDGLELLVYHALRDLGFSQREVYRSIVYRPSDQQHHMVTLWFEDRADPWVIDPTGAMVQGMKRMSSLPGWVPLKVFSDRAEYTVRPNSRQSSLAARNPG